MEKNNWSFNEAEIQLLKEGLKRTYKERFEFATRLYKIQMTMNKATIIHKDLANDLALEKLKRLKDNG